MRCSEGLGFIHQSKVVAGIPHETEIRMKNPAEVLRLKEFQLEKIKREIEALLLTAQLLDEDRPEPAARKAAKVVQLR
jgi:hypothetical protein